MDLVHSCGYVTLLNTGKSSRTIFQEELDDEFEEYSGPVSVTVSDCESVENGLKDQDSANVLASEIDLLESQQLQYEDGSDIGNLKHNLTLQLNQNPDKSQSCDQLKEDDWVLLDCHFGIALFDSNLNKDICNKVVSRGLFKGERYV